MTEGDCTTHIHALNDMACTSASTHVREHCLPAHASETPGVIGCSGHYKPRCMGELVTIRVWPVTCVAKASQTQCQARHESWSRRGHPRQSSTCTQSDISTIYESNRAVELFTAHAVGNEQNIYVYIYICIYITIWEIVGTMPKPSMAWRLLAGQYGPAHAGQMAKVKNIRTY